MARKSPHTLTACAIHKRRRAVILRTSRNVSGAGVEDIGITRNEADLGSVAYGGPGWPKTESSQSSNTPTCDSNSLHAKRRVERQNWIVRRFPGFERFSRVVSDVRSITIQFGDQIVHVFVLDND